MGDSLERDPKLICLFDVDGTLTQPRNKITKDMYEFMQQLRKKVYVGLVGGSDLKKICEQMGGDSVINEFDYVFSENGLVTHKNGELLFEQSIQAEMGEEKLQMFINYALGYMSKLTLPCKRGTFIEFRKGLINVCPVGRSCSQKERDEFAAYDKEHHIREKLVEDLKEQFPNLGLCYAIGGQISIDVFPTGWDKTYCLKQLMQQDGFRTVHFFGDKTSEGGNDYEIYVDDRTLGHTVKSPEDTRRQLEELFKL